MTIIERFKKREQENTEKLLRLLQCKEGAINGLRFECAYDYLENVFGTDAFGMQHLPKTWQFWTWWRMEWAKIDMIFLGAVEETAEGLWKVRDREHSNTSCLCRTVEELRAEYKTYHEASMTNRYINSTAVQAGAHRMMKEIINGTKHPVNHG